MELVRTFVAVGAAMMRDAPQPDLVRWAVSVLTSRCKSTTANPDATRSLARQSRSRKKPEWPGNFDANKPHALGPCSLQIGERRNIAGDAKTCCRTTERWTMQAVQITAPAIGGGHALWGGLRVDPLAPIFRAISAGAGRGEVYSAHVLPPLGLD